MTLSLANQLRFVWELDDPLFQRKQDALVLAQAFNTQSMTAMVASFDRGPIETFSLSLAEVAGKFGLNGGVVELGCGQTYIPTLLLPLAFETMHNRIVASGKFKVADIRMIVSSGQQHGINFLALGFEAVMAALDDQKGLRDQLELGGAFARLLTTSWMNGATTQEAQDFAAFVEGGALAIAQLTGAVPTPRFWGLQLLRFAREEPRAFAKTVKIQLISSLMQALVTGKICPVDVGDGLGGNVVNSQTFEYVAAIVDAMCKEAPHIREVLPEIVHPLAVMDGPCQYVQKRWGYSRFCRTMPGTGDNPELILGAGVYSDTQGIDVESWGSSHTRDKLARGVFGDPTGAGAVFGCASDVNLRLVITTILNGGISVAEKLSELGFGTRENIDWARVSRLLHQTQPGNDGQGLIYFPRLEIAPRTTRPVQFPYGGLNLGDTPRVVRALLEGVAINRTHQVKWMGPAATTILLTGGSSVNPDQRQIAADVADATYVAVGDETGLVGSVLRGLHGLGHGFEDSVPKFCQQGERTAPQNHAAYCQLLDGYPKQLANALAS